MFDESFFIGVSLPENDVGLALAAERGGANAIKVHLNVEHRASGVTFGSWEDEKERLRAIMRSVSLPVGVMPGANAACIATDAPHLYEEGFAFLDAYVEHIPAALLVNPPAPLMPSLGPRATPRDAEALTSFNPLCIEASIVDPAAYGDPLTLQDLIIYRELVAATHVPIVVPSQKRLVPADVPALIQAGCRGVLLGAVVFERTAESIEETVRRFRDAV